MIPTANRIVHSAWFQRFIIAVIILAGVLAGIETDADMMTAHGPLLRVLDRIILAVFVIEAALKLMSHAPRPWLYFKDGWNVFDFMVVVLCLLPIDSQFAVVLRLGRTLRLLRLVSVLPKLQLLVGALIKSFSSMGYVSLLLGIVFYIYAITGVHLFGGHDKENFGSLSRAFLTLFQIITLDDWRQLLSSASGSTPVGAVMYFVSFILLGTMIMLNLFIGIIMNSMSEMHAELEEQVRDSQVLSGKDAVISDLAAIDLQLADLQSRLLELRRKISNDPRDSSTLT